MIPEVPPPGSHGGDGADIARALGIDPADVLDLSMSLNPVAPPIGAVAGRHLDALQRYPTSGDIDRATAALAETMGVAADLLVLTNGGSEAITIVSHACGGGVWREPEFALHPRASDGPRWRSNPHNPTGLLAEADPDPDIAVWDEAFYPLATGTWTRTYPNRHTVVVGSLTKVFSCPGLRLGYVVTPSAELAKQLQARQPCWPVNGLALAVLPDLLDRADLPTWSRRVAELRDDLVAVLHRYGLRPRGSDANWVLVPDAARLRHDLARHAIVVRDCASFGLPGWVRIAVPDSNGLARLEATLARITPDEAR